MAVVSGGGRLDFRSRNLRTETASPHITLHLVVSGEWLIGSPAEMLFRCDVVTLEKKIALDRPSHHMLEMTREYTTLVENVLALGLWKDERESLQT